MSLVAFDAAANDYAAFARLFPELRVPDPTPSEEQFATVFREHTFFLREGDAAVAYTYWRPIRGVARVFHVVVDAAVRGTGVGRQLMTELASRARQAGCTQWMLHVKPGNVAAIRLYESFGMREGARTIAMSLVWARVAALPSDDARLTPSLAAPEDDAAIEAAFTLPPGNVASLRDEPERVLVLLREGNEVVGFAAFDPTFPGANPFRVRRPVHARALFEAMRPHARAEHAHVRFVLDVDETLVRTMAEAGAETVLEAVRMTGPIP